MLQGGQACWKKSSMLEEIEPSPKRLLARATQRPEELSIRKAVPAKEGSEQATKLLKLEGASSKAASTKCRTLRAAATIASNFDVLPAERFERERKHTRPARPAGSVTKT